MRCSVSVILLLLAPLTCFNRISAAFSCFLPIKSVPPPHSNESLFQAGFFAFRQSTALINLLLFCGLLLQLFFVRLLFSVVLLIPLLNLEERAFISCPTEKSEKSEKSKEKVEK